MLYEAARRWTNVFLLIFSYTPVLRGLRPFYGAVWEVWGSMWVNTTSRSKGQSAEKRKALISESFSIINFAPVISFSASLPVSDPVTQPSAGICRRCRYGWKGRIYPSTAIIVMFNCVYFNNIGYFIAVFKFAHDISEFFKSFSEVLSREGLLRVQKPLLYFL